MKKMRKFVYQNEIGEFGGDIYVHTSLKKALLDYCNEDDGTIEDGLFILGNGNKYPLDYINSEIKRMNYIRLEDDNGEPVLTVQRLELF